MTSSSQSLAEIQQRIDEVTRFLSTTLSIANAHTVEFFTHDVWSRFVAVPPQEVLTAFSSSCDQQREAEHKSRGTTGVFSDRVAKGLRALNYLHL